MNRLNPQDPWRPQFHLSPPKGLMNDPNGLIYYRGRYHVFFQWHPDACRHGLKSWGHFSSTDLLRWQTHSSALIPNTAYESHGCYSGCAVSIDGGMALLYTGNSKDAAGVRSSTQCLATSDDGKTFVKHGPVIPAPPPGYTAHFRDPKVWRENDAWWMVIGAQTVSETGTVLLYRGETLQKWSLVGPLLPDPEFGYMCECPDLCRFGTEDVLIFCPQGLPPQGNRFHNIYQAGYLRGHLDLSSGCFTPHSLADFDELDRGFDFYAPQTFVDAQGRRIMLGWMGLPEEETTPTITYGWTHCLTLPRVISLTAKGLRQAPLPELSQLRQKHTALNTVEIQGMQPLPVHANAYELRCTLLPGDASTCGLRLCIGQNNELRLTFDAKTRCLALDRSQSGAGIDPEAKPVRHTAPIEGDKIDLHIFVDHSCVEIFINEGEQVMSARCYPPPDATGIAFFSSNTSQATNVNFWTLSGFGVEA